METTIQEWLGTLPEPYRQRALNQSTRWKDEVVTSLGSAVLKFTTWVDTEEGSDFWATVYSAVRENRPDLFPDIPVKEAYMLVNDGLPQMDQLLSEHARYREALQRIAAQHPINDEPLTTAHSLVAHKALRPDCECGRCYQNKDLTKSPRSWQSDFSHDNGNYIHRCSSCGHEFQGNKHRMTCRECSEAYEARWAATSPAERQVVIDERLKAMAEILGTQVPAFSFLPKKPPVTTNTQNHDKQ